jgi:hypothetical protein
MHIKISCLSPFSLYVMLSNNRGNADCMARISHSADWQSDVAALPSMMSNAEFAKDSFLEDLKMHGCCNAENAESITHLTPFLS